MYHVEYCQSFWLRIMKLYQFLSYKFVLDFDVHDKSSVFVKNNDNVLSFLFLQ